MSAWQLIETAPKDGTNVILYARQEKWQCDSFDIGFWAEAGDYWAWSVLSEPTHWMPLPAPPEVSA